MAFDIGKLVIPVAVGAVDEFLERDDAKKAAKPAFQTKKDLGRLIMVGGGYALELFMPRYAGLGGNLIQSATPLLVKSLSHVLFKTGTAASRPAIYQAVAQRYPAPGLEHEFTGVRLS